jgi:flagellar biosynthetic protein FliQ
MDEEALIDLARTTLVTALIIVTPALLIGMTVGLIMSLFQTITSLQEQTLAIVPKIIAVVVTLLIMLPWILATLKSFATELFQRLPDFGPMV